MGQHPDQALPGLPFLDLQGPAEVGQYHQLMDPTVLAEVAAAHLPATGGQQPRVEDPGGVAGETRFQAERRGGPAQQPFRGSTEQLLGPTIHQPQHPGVVEREDGRVDLRHDGPKQGGGFQGSEPLPPQRVGKDIGLEVHQPEGVIPGVGTADPERIVALAQGRQDVGEGLQGPDHPFMQGTEPDRQSDSDEGHRGPAGAVRRVGVPQQQHRNDHGRQRRGYRDQEHSPGMGGHGEASGA